MTRSCLATVVALSLGGGASAWAQEGFPIDAELVRPGLSQRGGFTVDAPHAIGPLAWQAGALVQYTNAPLRLFDGPELVGPVVAHRTVMQIHAGISASRRTSFSLMLPVGANFGSDDEVDGARNGAGLGDAAITTRVHVGPWGRFSLGVLGTLFVPTNTGDQYLGERLPRLRAGLLGYTDLGRVALLTNLLVHVREPVDTGFDLVAGSELHLDVGVQGFVIPDTLDVIAELVTNVGLDPEAGGGRVAAEIVGGVRYRPRSDLRLDVALGRGLTEGYGTSGVRAMLGLTYVHVPRPRVVEAPVPPPPADDLLDLPDPPPEPPPAPAPDPDPAPAVAQLTAEQIEIAEPIAFGQGNAELAPSSSRVLDGVAEVLLGHPEVGHVVIEGHASEEGSYAYNYALSRDRAQAVFEALVLRGVHPRRMSFRGAGEVERVASGDTEAARAANRRVVFRVVRQYVPGEPRPDLEDEVLLPWSGTPHRVVTPVGEETEPEPEPEPASDAEPDDEPEPEPDDENAFEFEPPPDTEPDPR